MAQNGKPMPVLDQQSTRELNLTVLQRMDRHVEDILTTAAHVTFYEFNVEQSQWSRKDVEGSLFVVKRRTQPRFQFIVMNRRSTENLVEDLLGDFEYEVQVPYLLYRNAAQEVNGIWFYNSRECEEVAKLFSRILNAFSKIPPKPKLYASPSSEFQELEAVPTAALVEGPLEPSAPPQQTASEVLEEPLEQFFRNAVHIGSPETSASTSARPPSASHALSVRPASVTSPNLTPMPVPSPSPPSTGIPHTHTPMAPPLSLEVPDFGGPILLKPSYFVPPPLSSAPAVTPLVPTSISMQPSHGAPLLQPFPPPAPPPSLAPASIPHGLSITRDGVRDALFRLFQNDHFIDMVYREMLNAHST
ncbi:mRNA-decapping enzyme 1B [Marchantia polymorpha subsp. ruderalis]|uniref:WH1 domain-containing protein n=2 Tax=Marchantia polymorpha TaxID=3197 RepID=A0A176WM05_MARPO|nr:hypothetical protein AXG93_1200s1480 [Marchantia polymorpha subsp. ruderalis]PTQ49870.1 hypothetical protein MARPO_0002s0305 [Marchantia polymorpha]BBN00008.1 hypothetical protein Mp_1g25660 [Marchantia polymorpha subsp. ruderalis]|eukprot:PTQ49870.1 hypothetical protein MARPO_0002s0305 [Marchantia polymorpha]